MRILPVKAMLLLACCSLSTFAQTLPNAGTILPGETKNILTGGVTDADPLTIINTGNTPLKFCMNQSPTAVCVSASGRTVQANSTVSVTVADLGGLSSGNNLNVSNEGSSIGTYTVMRTPRTSVGCLPTGIWSPSCSGTFIDNSQSLTTSANVGIGVPATVGAPYPLTVNGQSVFNGNMTLGAYTTTDARLELFGGKLFTSNGWQKGLKMQHAQAIQFNTNGTQFGIGAANGNTLFFFNAASDADPAKYIMQINSNGSVGIGTTNAPNPAFKLSVLGKIRATDIVVETGWSDFVFDKGYRLMSLSELERYINEHHHLPEIPSAATVEEKGAEVAEMLKLHMQKIEELTLYIIEQNKKIEVLQNKVAEIEKK